VAGEAVDTGGANTGRDIGVGLGGRPGRCSDRPPAPDVIFAVAWAVPAAPTRFGVKAVPVPVVAKVVISTVTGTAVAVVPLKLTSSAISSASAFAPAVSSTTVLAVAATSAVEPVVTVYWAAMAVLPQ
jgi:hypothetical protein